MSRYPQSKYYYLKSRSKLKSERALLKMHTEMREEQMLIQWHTVREFASWSNIRLLVDERLEPMRNIAGIAGTAFSTIMSLLSGRRRRGCR